MFKLRPKTQKVQLIEILKPSDLFPSLRKNKKIKSHQFIKLTKNNFVGQMQGSYFLEDLNINTHNRSLQIMNLDELVESFRHSTDSPSLQKRQMQLLIPSPMIEGVRINGNYFHNESLNNAEKILINLNDDYEIFFKDGQILDFP